ncbi:DnaJ domain-containing protein [Citricoccus nitrophenolicus]|uniref:DnaJ domain-containing protein n=1 Tax=Citricoccus nitrophenolicus TaxID=863575 RepID=A0ABV0ILL7_9MICC|nr:DnaJ domain-containing protein [Cellulosimicrobium funkei]
MSPADLGGRSAYELLGVSFDADTAVLKAAWRRAARRTHPDYGGDAAEFRLVSQAWELVGDPEARRDYDRGFSPASAQGSGTGAPTGGPASGPSSTTRPGRPRAGQGAGSGTITYVPPLDDEMVLDLARSSQQIHGAPRKRGILPAGHRLVREARAIRTVQTHVLGSLPASRLVNGLHLTFGRLNSGAIDHVLLCGDRLAVIGSLQVPDGVYRWDGAELWKGDRRLSPPSLAPAMVALQRAFPDCTVGGFVLVLGPEDNPHAPVIQLDRTRSVLDSDAGFLTDPPANPLQFGRDLKMFLGTGSRAATVDRRLLARLLGAMY